MRPAWPVLILAVACSRGTPDPTPAAPGDVLAQANGLPVRTADFLAAMRAGRLGASPELVLDELINLTLVLKECQVIEGPGACEGPGTVLERAEAFLKRNFPPARVCNEVRPEDAERAYGHLSRHRIDPALPRDDPATVLAVEVEACEARAKAVRRAWITALRKGAVVRVDAAAVEAATRRAEEGR